MIAHVIGIMILIGIGYLIYKSIPPMDPKIKAPLSGSIDWQALGIDQTDLDKRKEYLDQLYIKVKNDLNNRIQQ